MKGIINVAFLLLLFSHVGLSNRPTDVNAAVLAHIASLGFFLLLLFAAGASGIRGVFVHRYFGWIALFLLYFFSVGVLISAKTGAPLREIFEFPYRIANLGIALLYPTWLASRDDARFLLRAGFALVLAQLVRDVIVGGVVFGSAILTQRLAGEQFASLFVHATLGFILGWAVADWDLIKRNRWLQFLLGFALLLFLAKILLMYSRLVWFVILPVDLVLVLLIARRQGEVGGRVMKAVGVMAVVGVITVLLNSDVRDTMVYRLSYVDNSVRIKLDEFAAVAAASARDPVLGRGFSGELEFWKGRRYRRQAHVHNMFLQFLLSSGVVGLMIFLWGGGLLVSGAWRLAQRARDPVEVGAALAVVLTVANFLMQGQVQSLFRREHTYLLIAFCLILLVTTDRFRHVSEPVT